MRTPKLETLALVHVGSLAVLSAWLYGGNISWALPLLASFGSLSLLILTASIRDRLQENRASPSPVVQPSGRSGSGRSTLSSGLPRTLHWLWPLLAYNLLVIISLIHPLFRTGIVESASIMIPLEVNTFWPASSRTANSLASLWLFDALFLSAFNLLITVRSRSKLRLLLLVLTLNAGLLAVFGSLQKLVHAPGLFFGYMPSPNVTFFASFIYHNHWGAFAVLAVATGLGLLFNALREPSGRDFWHSPAFGVLIITGLIAATPPLSTSRSCTVLVLILAVVAVYQAFRFIQKRRSNQQRSRLAPALVLILVISIGLVGAYLLAEPFFTRRIVETREQLSVMQAAGNIGARAQLYGDTWHMALQRPVFGWGLGCYGVAFPLFNTFHAQDGLPHVYQHAHSDWLQSLAETGFVGTALLGLLVAFPFATVLRHRSPGPLPRYLLFGCGLLLLYAWVEFPFGCPAVTLFFWLSLFTAARLVQIEARTETP